MIRTSIIVGSGDLRRYGSGLSVIDVTHPAAAAATQEGRNLRRKDH